MEGGGSVSRDEEKIERKGVASRMDGRKESVKNGKNAER